MDSRILAAANVKKLKGYLGVIKDGTDSSARWVEHTPSPRFAIYNADTLTDPIDDVVMDKDRIQSP